MRKLTLITLVILSFQNSFGQTLHELVEETFNFFPHQLSKEEQQELFPKLDEFFEKIISNKETYLQPLREELKTSGNNPYFYFDGGILLLELSKEKSDLQIVADALVKSDLRDLPSRMYLEHLLKLSMAGVDVIDPALHIFDYPDFQVFVPQHALLLNQGEALKFILPRYEPGLYVDKLIQRFESADSTETKYQILDLLFYASHCDADSFMMALGKNNLELTAIQERAAEITSMPDEGRKQNDAKQHKIRKKIRSSLTRISDEALHELFQLTLDLKSNYTCD